MEAGSRQQITEIALSRSTLDRSLTETPMEILSVEHVGKVYRRSSGDTVAIADLNFHVHQNEFVSIVGPSGCGKTTLLRIVAGLNPPTTGMVRLFGKPITNTVDDLVLVFQDYARSLCPWRNAARNVALALERVPVSRGEKRSRVDAALETVGLSAFAAHYPWEMSGGMQQRLQIARAIAFGPKILLMDEPFGSLDALTRFELEDNLLDLWTSSPKTILFVTHDIDEAIYLSDRVIAVTGRPSRVQAEFAVELPRPRHQIETRGSPEFTKLRGELLGLIGTKA
jgi:NitT/TauT family transport system ATP-binding protein